MQTRPRKPHTLMLVDEDEKFISIFTRYFTAGGYDIIIAKSVEETLAVWKKSTPDLMILNAKIAINSGPRFLGALKRQALRLNIPLISTGSRDEQVLLDDSRKDWAQEILLRPMLPQKIWDVIRDFLGDMPAPKVDINMDNFKKTQGKMFINPDKAVWSEEFFNVIIRLIYDNTGNLLKKPERLKNVITRHMRMLGIESVNGYLPIVQHDPKELATLIDLVTINETFFFRNVEQFNSLISHVLPKLANSRRSGPLRIWSAACSTGQEPYSLAMACAEAKFDCRIEITASDIDRNALDFARSGIYTEHMINRTPPEYHHTLLRYLEKTEDGKYKVTPEIRDAVHFTSENILEARHTDQDLVLCRNVMIYFDKSGVRKMIDTILRSLREEGLLIVGDSEYLACDVPQLGRIRHNKMTTYSKLPKELVKRDYIRGEKI